MEAAERHRLESRPSHRGRWFIIGAVIVAAALLWYAFRPSGDVPWNNQMIQAQFADLVIQRPEAHEEAGNVVADSGVKAPQTDVHVVLKYVLANHTGKPYRLPPPSHGSLMKSLEHRGLQDVDTVVWDGPLIPAGKTASVEFDLTLYPETEDLSGEHLQAKQNLVAFCNRRLKPIQSLVFFDYAHRYAIDLPRGWD